MVHQYFPVLGFTGMSQIQKLIKVFLTSPSTIFSKFNLFYQSQKKKSQMAMKLVDHQVSAT